MKVSTMATVLPLYSVSSKFKTKSRTRFSQHGVGRNQNMGFYPSRVQLYRNSCTHIHFLLWPNTCPVDLHDKQVRLIHPAIERYESWEASSIKDVYSQNTVSFPKSTSGNSEKTTPIESIFLGILCRYFLPKQSNRRYYIPKSWRSRLKGHCTDNSDVSPLQTRLMYQYHIPRCPGQDSGRKSQNNWCFVCFDFQYHLSKLLIWQKRRPSVENTWNGDNSSLSFNEPDTGSPEVPFYGIRQNNALKSKTGGIIQTKIFSYYNRRQKIGRDEIG